MNVLDPVECLYLALMHRWQTNAPPDQHLGLLDGQPAVNSQTARLAYVLQKIAAGDVDRVFSTLERHTRRRDGNAYISRQPSRMHSPYPLWDGWFLEGCVSMEQKRVIIRQLRHVGLSPAFQGSVEAFVAGDSIDPYFPTDEEQVAVIRQIESRDACKH